MKEFTLCLLLAAFGSQSALAEKDIGFIETFALAENRQAALKLLVPGTEDYYYYHALHAQNEGRFDDVEDYFEPWITRHGKTQRLREIQNRQALLRYPQQPGKSLNYLKTILGLQFNHQQQKLDAKPEFPTSLDPSQISWQAFYALQQRQSNNLNMVTDSGLDHILRSDVELDPVRRRALLSRLLYPDYDRLVGLIAADLRTKESRGFGEFQIHTRLLKDQLDELAQLDPRLKSNDQFVTTYLRKLAPSQDVDWKLDTAERTAYLNRMWDYADDLPDSFNSLKAHLLYRLLDHQRREGNYSIEQFRDYLKLPRQGVTYIEPNLIRNARNRADLNANFADSTSMPPIGSDEELVRDYLLQIFEDANSWEAWTPFILESYLKPLFAEAKLTLGKGDAARWFSMLNPADVQRLKERIDIEFLLTNETDLNPADAVTLDLWVKNVDRLMVKVYELNPLNFYLEEKRELNTDLNLDGLIANTEKTYDYDEAPIRRVRRTFTFDELTGRRGIWVIEFIGNGRSSRALIRKGQLQYLSHTTAAGIAITVLDKNNQRAVAPAVWYGGRKYEPNEKNGLILIPFSNQPGEKPIVLTDGDFASIDFLNLPQENYSLRSGFHLEQETLLPGQEAKIAISPRVFVNGQATTVNVLKDVKLSISTNDRDGITSVNETSDFELFDDRESVHTFRVPDGVRTFSVTLTAKVSRISGAGEDFDLTDSRVFQVNGIDASQWISDLHLSQVDGEFFVDLLGKTGEPLADRAVNLVITHRDFTRTKNVSLKTDATGRIALGSLDSISAISANSDQTGKRVWRLPVETHTGMSAIHQAAGRTVVIPLPDVEKLDRANFALFETRANTLVRDVFDAAKYADGLVTVSDLTPGNYTAVLRSAGTIRTVAINVTAAQNELEGYALSQHRHLKITNPAPLQIASIKVAGEDLKIQLKNADIYTRVHLTATRYLPEFDLDIDGLMPPSPERIERGLAQSLFLSGRDIGEEYRYILERRESKKFPGNSLTRPALILNPWVLQETDTTVQDAREGEDYGRGGMAKKASRSAVPASPAAVADEIAPTPVAPSDPNLTYLARQAPTVYNLAPDDNGVITIPRKSLNDRQFVKVLAINAENIATQTLSLPQDVPTVFKDLRLRQHLDPAKHFTQRQKVTVLQTGESLLIDDIRASEMQTYDTLPGVYAAMTGMNRDNATLAEFSFLTTWPTLEETKKRELYSEYACHELNFFLSRRDPDFFKTVVQPYLTNKRHKTFMDDYLTESDLSSYLKPWTYGRLNIVERILLARRLGGNELNATQRHVRELQALQRVNAETSSWYFRNALRGRGAENRASLNKLGSVLAEGGNLQQQVPVFKKHFLGGAKGLPSLAYTEAEEKTSFLGDLSDNFAAKDRMVQRDLAAATIAGEELQTLRAAVAPNFQKLEPTKEWAENNYYKTPIAQQIGNFITVNDFWKDYATWDGNDGFYSRHFPVATSSFAEMALALAVLDLPFTAAEHEYTMQENALTLKAASLLLVFHEEIEETTPPAAEDRPQMMISQSFFRVGDEFSYEENGEKIPKPITGEFLTGTLYSGAVVVSNPTATPQRINLLLQIPQGALPAAGSEYTKTKSMDLAGFNTQTTEFRFYFPAASPEDKPFVHFPVHVAKDERPIAWTEPATFNVVDKLSEIDQTSWDYLSQFGSEAEVIGFLENNNIERINLSKIAWRARENVDFFRKVISLLESRHRFDETLWSYGLHHDYLPASRQFLLHHENFLQQSGLWLESQLVSIEPVERHWYEHLEYSPLVNARAHQLGRDRQILNDKFRTQYQSSMKLLSYRPELSDADEAGVAYYLFLQDRVEEALSWLAKVDANNVETKLQHDYLQAYAALYRGEPATAGELAAKYTEYPVNRWRDRFTEVTRQVNEIQGARKTGELTEEQNRDQEMEVLAASEPNFEIKAEGQTISLDYRNLGTIRVNYYEMDLEFLFSSNPFVEQDSERFRYIKPNVSITHTLAADKSETAFEIPDQFASSNVLVEIVGAGQRKTAAIYANTLDLTVSENYGRLTVSNAETGKRVSTAYVKVYAKLGDGTTKFFKDGYTDLRGEFDYVSLNTGQLDDAKKFSLLIMSEENGATVREVGLPTR